MTAKISEITLATTAAAGDWLEIERAADGLSRRISKENLMGGTITGGGALATGGFTLTIPATGTAALKSGTPTTGRVASWSDANTVQDGGFAVSDIARKTGMPTTGRVAQWSDANTVADSTLAKTGAGVLTLAASGAFTLTVPETGTAALRNAANTFTANQTITGTLSATLQGVNDSHVLQGAAGQVAPVLNLQDERTWTPVITSSGTNPTVTYTTQNGRWLRIGGLVFYHFTLVVATRSGGSGFARISLPLPGRSGDFRAPSSLRATGITITGTPVDNVVFTAVAGQAFGAVEYTVSGGEASLDVTNIAAGASFRVQGSYFV